MEQLVAKYEGQEEAIAYIIDDLVIGSMVSKTLGKKYDQISPPKV